MTYIFSRFELFRTSEYFEDTLISEWVCQCWALGKSVVGGALPPLSVRCRPGPGQASAALPQSRNQHRSVTETSEGPPNPGCYHPESAPPANSSAWMASSNEVLTSCPSVAEHVEPVFHFLKKPEFKTTLAFTLTQPELGCYQAF